MSTPQPEASAEYSRGDGGSPGLIGRLRTAGGARIPEGPAGRIRAVAGLALLAGALLIVGEFLPLYGVQPAIGGPVVRTVTSGSHHGYALGLMGLVAIWLGWLLLRVRARVALSGLALLGAAALVIALTADLSSAQASGLLATGAGAAAGPAYQLGRASPQSGMYVETLGAVLLLASGAGGLLLFAPSRRPA